MMRRVNRTSTTRYKQRGRTAPNKPKKVIGRFLSRWDSSQGMPETEPPYLPFKYQEGDRYLIINPSELLNYKPTGTEYDGTKSIEVDDALAEIIRQCDIINSPLMYKYQNGRWEVSI